MLTKTHLDNFINQYKENRSGWLLTKNCIALTDHTKKLNRAIYHPKDNK